MKWTLAVGMGGLLLASAAPARAQLGSSLGAVSFPSATHTPATQFAATVVSGTSQDFVPTTYAAYDQALVAGRTANLAAAPKSLGEVAQEYRREPKSKVKFTFEQNEYGQAVVTRP